MIKTLQKHGNSRALVIDRPLMEAMGIGDDTPLQVRVDGHVLIVSAVHIGVGRERLAPILKTLRKRYGPMLKRLAE